MSHLLNSGQVGNIGLNHMKVIREQTQQKWDSLGFLDGLKGHVKENVAQLFENQATSLLTEATDATSSGSFETVVFPIVRRVFSKLLANDIVSVQAMNMPIGKLFYFVPQTSNRVNAAGAAGDPYIDGAQYSAHTSMASHGLPDCVDVSGGCAATSMKAKSLYDLYYNDGLFDNSKGTVTILTNPTVALQTLAADGTFSAAAALSNLPTATDGSLRSAILKVSGFGAGRDKGRLTGPDGNEMDTEAFLASLKVTNATGGDLVDPDAKVIAANGGELPIRLVTQKYGKGIVEYDDICDSAGDLYIEVDLTKPVDSNGTSTHDGYVGATMIGSQSALTETAFGVSWTQYASLELETELGEVSFKLDEVVVAVEERKLRATWSPELAQDVSAFHNIDAEAELTSMLSEQVAAEIDREILRDLRIAGVNGRWDYQGWRKASSAASPYTQKDWNQTLITKVNQISAQIHKSTLRGGANFVVVSSEISAIFDDLEYFHVSDANPEQDQYNMGIEKVGSLSGRYQIYRDPYAPAHSMIIGHKGKSLLDTGYIYAPYVPMQLTPTMYNPFNFAPVKGIMTRYAKKMVNNRFYGHIKVDGVPTFNVAELR
mgnify:CR=1 FL=1|tara:strand:+ start:665 stop:2467 length:1803 start_codon:yes stop_codon:yes gene_type:complete